MKLFKFEFDVHGYVPKIYTNANFHFSLFSGASLQIGEMLRFCNFLLLVLMYFFLGHAARSNP